LIGRAGDIFRKKKAKKARFNQDPEKEKENTAGGEHKQGGRAKGGTVALRFEKLWEERYHL